MNNKKLVKSGCFHIHIFDPVFGEKIECTRTYEEAIKRVKERQIIEKDVIYVISNLNWEELYVIDPLATKDLKNFFENIS